MRLSRIDLAAFGCLADYRTGFAPGLNVFFGENEAGKSTLQAAVCALLYGFYDGDRARPDETARHERFRPWPGQDNPPYRGALEYELQDGRRFEVRRDFTTADVPTALIDMVTGVDVASQYGNGRHGNVPFARRQLGMPRAVFQSCAFIGQGEVLEVAADAPRQVGDAIAALADSSRRDVSANSAMGRLDALLQRIGSDRARTAELPSAREALRVAERELAALEEAQRAAAQRSAELQGARARMASLERDVTREQVLFLKARSQSLNRRLGELAEADEALERAHRAMAELAEFAAFPSGLRETVIGLRDRLAAERTTVETARREAEERRVAVSDERRLEFEALRESAGGLSEATLQSLRAIAYAAVEEPARPGLLGRLLRRLGRILAAGVRALLRRQEPEVATDVAVAPALSREEAQALLDRHTRYLSLRPVIEALAESERRLLTAQAARDAAEAELRGVLAAEVDDLDGVVAEFLEGCRKHTLYEVAEAEAAEALRRRKLVLGERAPGELGAQLDECERRLDQMLTANPGLAGVEPDANAGEIARRLEGLQAERNPLEVHVARLEEEVRSSMRDHRPRAEIEEDVERRRREVVRLERARAAAQMARAAIEEAMVAVYRDFAPAVNAFLTDGFEQITGGRYQRAHVDPATLRVSLLVPETGMVITDPPVSRGTLTAAYILMRMGLAEHMSAIGEPVPLVLDDPFVDLDGRRLERMLEFIMKVAADTQVLLFTKDRLVLSWFESAGGGGRHRLHRLSAEAALVPAV